MQDQMDIFEMMYPTFKVSKNAKIHTIELFGGYGSQRMAMKRVLGRDIDRSTYCEWAVKSIQAYKDVHYTDVPPIDLSNLTDEEILNKLVKYGISMDYSNPMTEQEIKRKGRKWQEQVLSNIIITNNLVNISNVKGSDLDIRDDEMSICFYSFPCQDLSNAGKLEGMKKGSGTRSGLLWEVERILLERKEQNLPMPNVLLMENVPGVIGTENVEDFKDWIYSLEQMGYRNYVDILDAKDYTIPQNRRRCFMISLLGEYSYKFPQPVELKLRAKNIYEKDIDESYYLSNVAIEGIKNTKFEQAKLESMIEDKNGIMPTILSRDYKDPKLVIENDTTTNSEME